LLFRYGIRVKKHLGQNFLIDPEVLQKIIQAADLTPEDSVIEIGAGPGILTGEIARRVKKVFAIELDEELLRCLKKNLSGYNNVEIIKGDVLKTDFSSIIDGRIFVKIIANLPYYITTPILMHLLKQNFVPSTLLVLMVQKEVGLRLVALPGCKDYGILSIVVQYYTKPELFSIIPRVAFFPRPEVDSSLVKLTILDRPPVELKNEKLFFSLVRASFGHRRKTLANALLKSPLGFTKFEAARLFTAAGIDCHRRAEELSLEDFARLSNELSKLRNTEKETK